MTEREYFVWRKRRGFKNRQWRFAATVQTPLDRIPWFVGALLHSVERIDEATVHLAEVVFEPKALNEYRRSQGITSTIAECPAYLVTDVVELRALLEAVFADWVDFTCYVSDGQYAFAGDHDEWTRIFAMSRRHLEQVMRPLRDGGITFVESRSTQDGMPRERPTL